MAKLSSAHEQDGKQWPGSQFILTTFKGDMVKMGDKCYEVSF